MPPRMRGLGQYLYVSVLPLAGGGSGGGPSAIEPIVKFNSGVDGGGPVRV